MGLRTIVNEADLLQRIANDDERAFEQLFHAYHQPISSFVRSLVGSRELTEEILHDVFTSVWQNRKALPRIQKFTSYLFVQTRNHSLNCIKKLAAERGHQQQYTIESLSQTEGEDLREEYEALLESGISKLPEQQRRVFLLRREGLRNPEIASRLGIASDSVKKYHQLAMLFLSRFVKEKSVLSVALSILFR